MFKFISLKYTKVLQSHQHPPSPAPSFQLTYIVNLTLSQQHVACSSEENMVAQCVALLTGLSLRAGGSEFPWLLLMENKRKLEPKETQRCLIPRLLLVFTRQLEILTTTLT